MSSIYEALNHVANGLGPILKRRIDAGRGGSYQAFSVDDVYKALHPLFAEHGVIVAPQAPVVEYVERDRTDRDGKTYGVTIDARVSGRWLLYGLDGTSLEVGFTAEARDTGDKATIQASQQAFKYALVQMFLVAAGDPDPETPPEPATPAKSKLSYLNAAKQHVLELVDGDKPEAALAWPLILESAKVDKVTTKKEYEAVLRAANDMFTTEVADVEGE